MKTSGGALFFNRELSWIAFNRRVLEEAADTTHPLLERVKFLAIFSSNMDEFFMVRVAGLKQQRAAGVGERDEFDGLPAEQLAAIREAVQPLIAQQRALCAALLPELAQQGIFLLDYAQLDPTQHAYLTDYYARNAFPVLTPLALDPGHPFPHISNLSMNLAVTVRSPEGVERFARVKVPNPLPRLIPVPVSDPHSVAYAWIEQIITANLPSLFPGMTVVAAHPFRVIRNADLAIQEDEAGDLLHVIAEGIRQRHFGFAVRLTVNPDMPESVRAMLLRNLKLDPTDLYVVDGPLGLSQLIALHKLDRPTLKDPPIIQRIPRGLSVIRKVAALERESGVQSKLGDEFFASIRKRDILLHHPYDSFQPVIEFIRLAASDPNVLAIKQTLYRVGSNSPIVRALMKAREDHKQVSVLVELKARFDEESNIEWARALERQGVHVVYGLVGLKTHCKIALVVRREPDGLQRYVHLSTGNYNVVSATSYTDFGLFTSHPDFGADASDLFNYLTGHSLQTQYRKLLIAPVNLRERFTALIERETEYGPDGHLIFKMNALADPPLIRALYRAAQAGVRIDLLVRGICCLRPGVPGLSETIRVTSLVGRFLEHSRAYYFHNRGESEVYLGSADLMPRNLNRRVEILFPIEDSALRAQIREGILATYLADTAQTRLLQPDGAYTRLAPPSGEAPFDSQAAFLPARRLGGTASE